MASDDGAVNGLTMADRVQKIRSRLSALFAGNSSSSSCSIENSHKPPHQSPGEMRMFAPGSGGSLRDERNNPSGRRSISSTGSVIDRNASPNGNIPPFSPPNTESSGNTTSSGFLQRVENQIHRGVLLVNWVQHSVKAHPPPKRKSAWNTIIRRMLCIGPRVKARSTRRKLIDCAVSGILLASVLTTYLVLAVTSSGKKFEFHVILIIVLMACTIYFCHSLIRLLMMAKRRPVRQHQIHHGQPIRDPGIVEDFTITGRPIPVIFASDLEMGLQTEFGGNENKPGQISVPPPAYGFWRGSVKMDPNRLYWQRIDPRKPNHRHSQSLDGLRPPTTSRPPSYISDDREQYIANPQPQLPPHAQVQPQPSGAQNTDSTQHPNNTPP
ncbi:hypothetical protein MGYG_05899 [Nannizzia gypsea CBS 118893]|uniref:Uncharacterized protein n=1 Tax=Arthroderma gypseum (strain ATCC MYA-4604 / CBS 118893) TaxID=535722 RepID=E4UZW1_ARTGP|nr:hypothetical protein MGYG_05899 [Nannizzia gypsea CBS 118893]EFR02898.1 hypothetical protein MGYG_05899 [Nannizzia gypsea CBS 118893]